MEQQINKINYRLLIVLFLIYEVTYLLIFKFYDTTDYTNVLAYALIFAFVYIIYLLILGKNENKLLNKNNKLCYLYIGISLSVICILFSEFFDIYHVWMIGCFLISIAYGAYFGIITTFMILFLDGLCNSYAPEEYIYYETLGIIICLLFEFLPETKEKYKNIISYFYFLIIGISCNISLYLITNRLNYELLFESKFYYISLYTLAMITVTYIIGYFFISPNEDAVIEENDFNVEDMLKNDYELLVKMKKDCPVIFKHSLVVGDISKRAAALIGADSSLCMAGGIYHEVGKISDAKDYLIKNREIAEQYEFNSKFINIIMSHNIKEEEPKSKEAAIIYFTDNILNTIFYMKNVRKDTVHTNKQIIESFFNKNIKDERLYGSGLTIAEYGILREFYIKVFDKQEG